MPERTVTTIPANPTPRESREPGEPLRVAAYCRVSTNSEEQLSSHHSQIEYYTNLIEENPNWKLAGIFADEGLSGTSTKKRTEFNKMIRKCRNSRIDLVITKSVSRFARNSLDCINYIRKLRDWGVAVYFEKESINTLEDPDETLVSIMAILAQNESMSLSKNVRMGIQYRFKAGKLPYHTILGYCKGDDGNLEIVPEEAEIIRLIYEKYLSGLSTGSIRNELEATEIPSPRGKATWSEAVIQNILQNEKYAGDAMLQKTYVESPLTGRSRKNLGEFPQYYVENNHPAIIDRETFDRVQLERVRRGSKSKRPARDARTRNSKYSGKFALTEILICGECGAFYRHTTWANKDGGRRPVWRCVSRLEHGKKYCRRSVTLDESLLHEAIRTAINQVVFKELVFDALFDSASDVAMPELFADLQEMYLNEPPELAEYDDNYTRALIRKIEVQREMLQITFRDGTSIIKSV